MKRFIVLAALIMVVMSFLPVSQKKDAAETDSDSSAEVVTTDTDAADTVTEPAADSVPEPERTAAAAPVPAEAEREDDDGYYRFRGYIFTFDRKIIVYSDGSFRVFTEEADEAFANLLSDASMVSGDAKLGPSDYRTSDAPAYLRRKNPTPCWADELHPYGQSVKLTVSEQDQINAYNFLKAHGFKGCVLKMCSDGAIRAAASYPSFSHNARLAGAASSLQNERDAFNNQCFVPMLPGSTFKILSAVVAKKNGMTEFQDPGALPAFKIKNWDYDSNPGQYPRHRTIQDAILNSSNCVFANVFYELGAAKVQADLDSLFGFSQPLETDIATVVQQSDMRSGSALARCGYGQRVTVSPLFMGTAALAAAATGEMVTPYMVDETYDTKLFTPIAQVGSKQVRTTIPAEYTEELREGMKAVTANLLLHKDGCTILTKTGTAAVDHSGYGDFASICSVVQNDSTGEAEVLLLVVQNPGDFGYKYASNLKGAMQELLDLLM